MAVIETWYNQDLQQPVKVRYLDGSMFSHNGNGNRIGVRVYNDGEPVTLTGTVSGYVITSDGSTVPCVGARSGNEATITIPPAAYQPGIAFITIFLTDGSTVTTLCAVQTSVLQARTGSQVSPGSVVQDWTQTINAAMQDVQTAADNLGGIVATPYASLTYPVPLGKYTYYNGNLYRCISAIAASEEFTAAHWTQVRLGDDVTDLKDAVGYHTQKIIPARISGQGTYYRTEGSTSLLFDVAPGDVVEVTAGNNGISYLNMLKNYTDNQSVVQYATGYSGSGTPISGTITATVPSDAVYGVVLLNVYGTSDRTPKSISINGELIFPLLTSRVESLESEVDEVNTEITTLVETVAEHTSDISDINTNFETVTDKTDELYQRANGYDADALNTYTYNPNPSNEGLQYPSGAYGTGSCLFDVSDYVGQSVEICGTEIGWLMQFTDTPGTSAAPSRYIGGSKTNGNSQITIKVVIRSTAKYLAVNAIGDKADMRLYTDNQFATKKDLTDIVGNEKWYVAIGDSITAGSGASRYAMNFYWQLSEYMMAHSNINKRINLGVAGAASSGIAANCGAYGLYITSDVSLPATTTGVNIPLNVAIKNAGNALVNVNPCYLDGIEGSLTYSGGNYVFTRTEAGTAKTIAAGTSLLLYGGKIAQNADITTIFVGTNNALDTNPSDERNRAVRDQIKTIANLSESGKFIVISPYVNSVNANFRALLSAEFGQRYFDAYAYFSGQGVLDAIAEGLLESGSQSDWTTLLLADGVHPNDAGHTLLYERIRDRMISLGWIT